MKARILIPLTCSLCALPGVSYAQTFATNAAPTADAFIATGSAGNPAGTDLTGLNFGGAGTLAISPSSSTKGEFDTILKFNLASTVSQFNTTYGVGNWAVTGLTLKLASNTGVQGTQPGNGVFNSINAGNFDIQWVSVDNWIEGTGNGMGTAAGSSISFSSMSTLFAGTSDGLGTYTYTPPGNNVYVSYTLPLNGDLVSDVDGGGDVSLYFSASAASAVGYLFNARSFGANTPEFIVGASATPEPATIALLAVSLGGLFFARKARS
jgi:hypothetical protein